MELTKMHWIGLGIGFAIVVTSLFFLGKGIALFLMGMGILIGAFPFVLSVIHESKISSEKEDMFLEFSRNLVESVKTGTPVSKSIVNLRNKSFGALTVHIKKLANQISMGIPLNSALKIFSNDVNNKTVSRAITLIGQAERAGGDIGEILEAVAEAVSMSEKLKKERKATISTLVVQGYIIFFVFLAIILIMQFKILPMVSGMGAGAGSIGGLFGASFGGGGAALSSEELSNAFLYLLLVQGFFSGLTIGKLAEGSAKAGIKHSFALMMIAFLVSAGSNLLFGG